jgi:hypothetical protein
MCWRGLALLLQQQHDLEEQAQRSAILPGSPRFLTPRDESPQIELDLTKIKPYEEYR